MHLSADDRMEVIMKLLLSIRADTARIDPIQKQVNETNQKIADIEQSLEHVYGQIDEVNEELEQVTTNKEMDQLKSKV